MGLSVPRPGRLEEWAAIVDVEAGTLCFSDIPVALCGLAEREDVDFGELVTESGSLKYLPVKALQDDSGGEATNYGTNIGWYLSTKALMMSFFLSLASTPTRYEQACR